MAAVAEIIKTRTNSNTNFIDANWMPSTFVGPEMAIDAEVRLRAGQFIGAVASNQQLEIEPLPEVDPIESLYDGITKAHEGDVNARKLVAMNVGTDVVERTLKKGHVMNKVPLMVTDEGKVLQFGQAMDSIQANSLRYAAEDPVMLARTEAETRNKFRTEQYYKDGFFDNYSMLVVSRAEDMQMFFTESMSCSLQLTSKSTIGLELESAFVAGVAVEGEDPHDAETAVNLGAMLGADYRGMTPAQIIDTPILIHNSLIPNGVIDVAKLWDKASGLDTFFGEAKPPQDYLDYLELCHAREASYRPKIDRITDELIAAAPTIGSPLEAVFLLNDLSGLHMVEQAITDPTIDSRVFGHEAAAHIDAARMAYMQGDLLGMQSHQLEAVKTESSSSCPSALKNSDKLDALGNKIDADDKADDADCDFISKECPECHTKNVKTKVQKLKQTGKKRISGSCGCSVVANAA